MKAIVVHGHRDPGCHRISGECRRRVAVAARMSANAIVFSGRGVSGERSEAEQMAGLCPYVDGRAVWREEDAETTAENARQSMRLALVLRASHVVVVTSWWHVPRAWLEWQRVAIPGVRVSFRPARGSVRYLPGELGALWRATDPNRVKAAA